MNCVPSIDTTNPLTSTLNPTALGSPAVCPHSASLAGRASPVLMLSTGAFWALCPLQPPPPSSQPDQRSMVSHSGDFCPDLRAVQQTLCRSWNVCVFVVSSKGTFFSGALLYLPLDASHRAVLGLVPVSLTAPLCWFVYVCSRCLCVCVCTRACVCQATVRVSCLHQSLLYFLKWALSLELKSVIQCVLSISILIFYTGLGIEHGS